jgi:hypothetical protein
MLTGEAEQPCQFVTHHRLPPSAIDTPYPFYDLREAVQLAWAGGYLLAAA